MRPYPRAFTLIELLMVVAIIGLLSSIVLASLNTARMKARDSALSATGDGIANLIANCTLANGRITAPNSALTPTNDLCTLGAAYGKWPTPPTGWQWYTSVWTQGQESLMYALPTGDYPSRYSSMYCGIYPPFANVSGCNGGDAMPICRMARTYMCVKSNAISGEWE